MPIDADLLVVSGRNCRKVPHEEVMKMLNLSEGIFTETFQQKNHGKSEDIASHHQSIYLGEVK